MNEFSWDELSQVLHSIRDERVIITGTLIRIKEIDRSLERIEDRINDLILKKDKNG